MTPRTRRIIEFLLIVAIAATLGFIGWRIVRHLRAPPLIHGVPYDEPNVKAQRVTIPGRPHDVPSFITNPKAIQRRVTFTFSTNSLGLRNPEVDPIKPPGLFRIAAVGECVTFGNGVEEDQAWPRVLETMLRTKHPDRSWEVVNAGCPNPPSKVLETLQQRAMGLHPDLVLYAPGTNTFFLSQHTVNAGYQLELPAPVYDAEIAVYRTNLQKAWDTTRLAGARFVLVTATCNSFFLPDAHYWIDALRQFGSTNAIPVVDTTALFLAAERQDGLVFSNENREQRLTRYRAGQGEVLFQVHYAGDRWVSPEIYAWLDAHPEVSPRLSIDENHPTAEGHRLIAEAVLGVVEGVNNGG